MFIYPSTIDFAVPISIRSNWQYQPVPVSPHNLDNLKDKCSKEQGHEYECDSTTNIVPMQKISKAAATGLPPVLTTSKAWEILMRRINQHTHNTTDMKGELSNLIIIQLFQYFWHSVDNIKGDIDEANKATHPQYKREGRGIIQLLLSSNCTYYSIIPALLKTCCQHQHYE